MNSNSSDRDCSIAMGMSLALVGEVVLQATAGVHTS